jgi:hypothetical protein
VFSVQWGEKKRRKGQGLMEQRRGMMSQEEMVRTYLDVEDLQVYQKLCLLHIEICDLSHGWPSEERYELGSQIRRSSNSSPAQLAEKNDDQFYEAYRERYKECIRMLNGLEKSLEKHLPEKDRRWLVAESSAEYNVSQNFLPPGWPPLLEP